jgi:two-component system sensor histidine kinase KdpD
VVEAARQGLPAGRAVRVAVDPGLPEIRADAAQLERALANLLENAARYSPTVSVTAHRAGRRLVVSVVDRGPGVPPGERERIFEPFYRGAGSENGAASGSGLGLAIARGFVEAAGGTIHVDSLPGQGTSFVISLPLEPEPEPTLAER